MLITSIYGKELRSSPGPHRASGPQTALVLAELGASIAIGYHNNRKCADEVAAKITPGGGKAVARLPRLRS